MARQWVKLWTKMVLNPQVAEMTDYLYRRWIEIMLLAGMNDEDGKLQPVSTMAYILHLKEVSLSENLTSLMQAGVVHQETDGTWHVTNWKKHQFSESTDRVRKYRDKKQKEESAVPPVSEERYSNKNVTPRYSALPSPLISSTENAASASAPLAGVYSAIGLGSSTG